MSERAETNGTSFPTWSVAMPANCLAAAFVISQAATALGGWSVYVAGSLVTLGIAVVAIAGLRGAGIFGGSALGSWLLLIFAVWPLGSELLSAGIASADPQNASLSVAMYPLLAAAFTLIAFVSSALAARSMPLLPAARYALAALFGAILLTLAISWTMALVNLTGFMGALSALNVVLVILTEAMPLVFAASLIWFGYIQAGQQSTAHSPQSTAQLSR